MDYKNVFEKVNVKEGFIKTQTRPPVSDGDKAALNRKGNVLFNAGDVEGARRIFLTTGYSDGLSRVGDFYKLEGRELDALRMYWIAPDRRKADPIIEKLAGVVRGLLAEDADAS
ncbi:MAG: hypothetical protein LBR16_06915 [Treponema sp.]|jgi:hypothetical protein|nr:hypothetical protein [Treponema sp.]